ncbi:TetR/AcrR family transcriptional regulator [Arthrobacter castelli]|uniref:TetR/AcrR family transcriptional regulator n=1 Tax=Arthrobacter castelli TaxID=271431 RepID=UPI0003FE2E3F|nr:TetR/AcrR family transcriptional regulator [Arthrobacter castelli]
MSRVVANTITGPANARSRRTRIALLDSARAILESGGFPALTMAAVADHAGVTRRAVYLHFTDRAELTTCLFDHISAVEDLAASLARVWAAPEAGAALERWAEHLARYHPRIRAIDLASAQAADIDSDAHAHRQQVAADQQAACRRLALWLAGDDRLAAPWTPDTVADLLWALMSSDMLTRLLHSRKWSTSRYAENITLVLQRTFLADKPQH